MPAKKATALCRSVIAGAVALSCAGCGVPDADGPADSFGIDFSLPASAAREDGRPEGALIFVVDGVGSETFDRMLRAGELPALREHLVDRGLYVPRAVANVPSVTMANLTSLITGRLPGHHGVTGVNWFDRNRLVWRNYETIAQKNALDGDYTAANLFERFPDRTTFSLFFQPHRGATKFVENWTSAGPPFLFGWFEFVDRLTLFRLHIVADVARKRGRWPAVTVCYLLAPDFRAYEHGVRSHAYRAALRHTDRQIGRVLGDLRRARLLDRLLVVFTSDHGLGQVDRHWPIERFLRREVGLDVARQRLWESTPFERRLDCYRRRSAVLYGSGDRYWAVCLRRPIRAEGAVRFAPWPVRPRLGDLQAYPTRGGRTVNLPSVLAARKAVDAVAYAAGPGRVRVRRKAGVVEFRQPGGPRTPISYHVLEGRDPLRWADKLPPRVLAGEAVSGRTWLDLTAASEFPDLPEQILAYFRARRAGDLAVFAAPGWDFGRANRAGHGGLRPTEMHVPLLLAGPGVRPGRLEHARTVDLAGTLLRLLGRTVPADLDGRCLGVEPAPAPGNAAAVTSSGDAAG